MHILKMTQIVQSFMWVVMLSVQQVVDDATAFSQALDLAKSIQKQRGSFFWTQCICAFASVDTLNLLWQVVSCQLQLAMAGSVFCIGSAQIDSLSVWHRPAFVCVYVCASQYNCSTLVLQLHLCSVFLTYQASMQCLCLVLLLFVLLSSIMTIAVVAADWC